jgi:DNA-binding MarR family transcriptional regulator
MTPASSPDLTPSTAALVTTGLAKIGLALRSRSWQASNRTGVTPTQAAVVDLLDAHRGGLRLTAVAEALGVSAATTSDTVAALVEKGLVARLADPDDARAVRLRATRKGLALSKRLAGWPEFLRRAVATLDDTEQGVLLRGLVKMIRALQEAGDIPVQRMCVSCRFFQPNVHREPEAPHHCDFVDAPFGDRALRVDCGDHETVDPATADLVWVRFVQPGRRTTGVDAG